MEVGGEDASSSSASDATRGFSSSSESESESSDGAHSNAALRGAAGAVFVNLVNLAEDEDDDGSSSEAEFEIVPAAPTAQHDVSDADNTLPIDLAGEPTTATSSGRKRKRLRGGNEPATDVTKPAKPTIVVKPQPTECTVCYDPCTLSGRHRLVSLKCGHVFGKKCIDRWVVERKTCPNCSLAVRKTDIRPLFTDHVAVVDNSGLENMTQKFEGEKSRRIQIETELSRAKLQLQLAQQDAKRFQDEAERWRKQAADLQCRIASDRFTSTGPAAGTSHAATPCRAEPLATTQSVLLPSGLSQSTLFSGSQSSQYGGGFVSQPFSSTPPRPPQQYVFQQTARATPVVLSQSAPVACYRQLFQFPVQSSRVCAFTSSCSMVCVGEALGAASFGIVKLSTADSRHAVRISAHSSAVRDLSINAQNDLVLSVAWDGKAAVSSLRSDSVVMQYTLPPSRRNAWSCCFSQANPFEFFCGFQDGTIARYDMRRQATTADESIVALYRLPAGQPVHSIQLSPVMGGGLEQLIAGTFSGFGIWGSDKLRQPSVGETPTVVSSFRAAPNCCSVSGSQTKRSHLLVTTRSQPPTVSAKHALYELPTAVSGSSEPVLRSSMEGFRTPQAMSRAAVWEARSGDTMVASWDDELKQVNIWNETSKQVQSRLAIEGSQSVVDVQHAIADGEWRRAKALLGVLSPQRLVVYAGSE